MKKVSSVEIDPRPTFDGVNGSLLASPKDKVMIQLLGSAVSPKVGHVITHDQYKAIQRMYGFTTEKRGVRPEVPPEPVKPQTYGRWDRTKEQEQEDKDYDQAVLARKRAQEWTDDQQWRQAGADRNMGRFMESDGFRLVTWLAKYVEAGQDPVKVLVQLACDAGWDVDPADVDWANADLEPVEEDE